MAIEPVILCLNQAGFSVANKIANKFSFKLHGRSDRVTKADKFFDNALYHARVLFSSGTPIIGVCASGILIQFPLYFGIMGIMNGSGLVDVFSDFFVMFLASLLMLIQRL